MTISFPWLAVFASVVWILWKFFCRFLLKSPLDNVPGPPRSSILQGNIGDLFNRHAWDFHDNISRAYGPVLKLHGTLGSRALYVYDPKALNSIILKEQSRFEEPSWLLVWNDMVFGPSLLSTHGIHHRQQRKMLNPVFSISHMRHMSPIFYSVVHKLQRAVAAQVGTAAKEVNVMDWMTRTALELVGQGGLGYSFDPFDPLAEPKPNVFSDALKSFVPASFSLQTWRMASPYFLPYVPKPVRKYIALFLLLANMRKLRDVAMTMDQQARLIYSRKMEALEKGDAAVTQQIGEGKDILSILVRANMHAKGEEKLDEEELIAQIARSTLVFAATDTTSSALSRTFHLLAQHQDVQDKIRAELKDASPDGTDIPYNELVNLPYLDAVCRETLRLFSPVTMISREAREDTVLPLSEPIQGINGTMMNEIPVPKDTVVLVGVRACNRNKAIWGEDALQWKPERWLAPLPDSVTKAHLPGVYSNLMTFAGGGRSCIGLKFSQLEMKVVLAVMLRSFKFSLSDKDIYWNVGIVSYPTVGKVDTKGTMPLKLEAIRI